MRLTVQSSGQPVVVHGGPELAHGVQRRSQVVQDFGQQGGPLSRGAQSLLETLYCLLERPEPAVRHAHRQVQLT